MKDQVLSFEELSKQLNISAGMVKILSETLMSIDKKRTLRNFKIEKKISDLQTILVENYFDDGSMCGGCWKNPDTCEGSYCSERMEEFFGDITAGEAKRKAFEIFGDRYYSFSRRIKIHLKR